ncbi:hypothetical protein FEM48_Zijuj07G0162600 [Ziziphus jujuba var. spinosa]|uniref:Uncharacterized protein n=1 Tax=Ziziphus jujuba var. spinosa TaxID=714518 RepID=A0A978V5N0_ZIZJJ|nr:hypothetical protein FEM48_Zijuj07G0162600 [Ziziphus jujuba var. spinosa]
MPTSFYNLTTLQQTSFLSTQLQQTHKLYTIYTYMAKLYNMPDSSSSTSNQSSQPNNDTTLPTSMGALVYINVTGQSPLCFTTDNYIAWHAQWFSLPIGYELMGDVNGKDELTFHVLNGLGPNYKESSITFRAHDTFMPSYMTNSQRMNPSSIAIWISTNSSPLMANFANHGKKSNQPSTQSISKDNFTRGHNSYKSTSQSRPHVICQFCEIPGHTNYSCHKILTIAPWLSIPSTTWKSPPLSSSSSFFGALS